MTAILTVFAIEAAALALVAALWRRSDNRRKDLQPDVTPPWATQIVELLGVVVDALELFTSIADAAEEEPEPADAEPGSWLDEVTARRILVHTTDDRSIEGLLLDVYPEEIVLKGAKLLGREAVDLGGEVYLQRSSIALIQMMPEATVTDVNGGRQLGLAVP